MQNIKKKKGHGWERVENMGLRDHASPPQKKLVSVSPLPIPGFIEQKGFAHVPMKYFWPDPLTRKP